MLQASKTLFSFQPHFYLLMYIYLIILAIQYQVNFKSTIQSLNIYISYNMITSQSLVIICHHSTIIIILSFLFFVSVRIWRSTIGVQKEHLDYSLTLRSFFSLMNKWEEKVWVVGKILLSNLGLKILILVLDFHIQYYTLAMF